MSRQVCKSLKKYSWQFLLVLALVGSSVFAYLVYSAIFQDSRHIFLYLIGDIAFLPVRFASLQMNRGLGPDYGFGRGGFKAVNAARARILAEA